MAGPRHESLGPWLIARTLQAAVTLALTVTLLFFLMRIAPGDPLEPLVGERQISREEIESLRRKYGLDRPLLAQFTDFAAGVVRGDLGVSITQHRPVRDLLRQRLPASLLLGGTVLLINFSLGLWIGVWQAARRGRLADRVVSFLTLTGYAMPSFWLGLLLIWLVAIRWHLLPAGGMEDPLLDRTGTLARLTDVLRHLLLPALTLSVVSIAATIRYQRRAMIEVLRLDFIRTARSQGLAEQRVTWRSAWRNALFPVVTLFGLWLPLLVTGSVFVESVFAWPGLGLLAQEAIGGRDYPLLMGTALLVATGVIVGGWLADVGYAALDPRVRYR